MKRLKNFEKTINSFAKRPNKNCVGFKIHSLPFLPETLIVMMKSDVITEHVGLPIVVQIGIGSNTITRDNGLVGTKSM